MKKNVVQENAQTGLLPGTFINVGTIGEHLIFVSKPNLIDETN